MDPLLPRCRSQIGPFWGCFDPKTLPRGLPESFNELPHGSLGFIGPKWDHVLGVPFDPLLGVGGDLSRGNAPSQGGSGYGPQIVVTDPPVNLVPRYLRPFWARPPGIDHSNRAKGGPNDDQIWASQIYRELTLSCLRLCMKPPLGPPMKHRMVGGVSLGQILRSRGFWVPAPA